MCMEGWKGRTRKEGSVICVWRRRREGGGGHHERSKKKGGQLK